MKAWINDLRGILFGETTKRTLLGSGLFGASHLGAGCVLACLVVWFVLALVIVLLWVLVAFLASVIPL